MFINLTYVFFILVGIYFGIIAYIATRKRQIFLVLGVFLFSFFLELLRLDSATYTLNINDSLWTSRDIMWTGIMIYLFDFIRKRYPHIPAKVVNTHKKNKKIKNK